MFSLRKKFDPFFVELCIWAVIFYAIIGALNIIHDLSIWFNN